jgi:SWI/SNF-related matrix-associated actin-dependent regulator of chromatin subfamily A member 5
MSILFIDALEELTEAEQLEKDKLLTKGFGNWGKKEFFAFLRGCEKYGRNKIADIARDIETKTEKEVREYSNAFWKNYKRIAGASLLIFFLLSPLFSPTAP